MTLYEEMTWWKKNKNWLKETIFKENRMRE
jgi:hypothetical protein